MVFPSVQWPWPIIRTGHVCWAPTSIPPLSTPFRVSFSSSLLSCPSSRRLGGRFSWCHASLLCFNYNDIFVVSVALCCREWADWERLRFIICRVCHWRLSLYLCFVYKRQHAMQPLPTHCILQLICPVNKGISICSPRCLLTSTVQRGTTQGLHNDKFQIGFWRHLLQHFWKVKSVTTPPRPEAFGVFALKSGDQSLMLYIWKQSIFQRIIQNVLVSFWCYDTRGATRGDNRQSYINLFFYL